MNGTNDPIDAPEGFLAELRAAYATPPRAYHHWGHVERVLEHVREVGWIHPREVWVAALFHDAIYVAGAADNEARSATLAREMIERWMPDAGIDLDRVAALIELTARHGKLTVADVDPEAALFLDCDTAVIGAPADEFDRYDTGIAREWAGVVAADAYRAGRAVFLERMLAAPRIFLSDSFHARLDAAARANLRRAIKSLREV